MGKDKERTLILGEGPTEFYYFESLRDVFTGLTIQPDYPKHTSLKELELKIAEGINLGYRHIFCIIDMDTKDSVKERTQYERLKKKYLKPILKPKKGLNCEVKFFETHRCTELFFLYYFRYTSREYGDQDLLIKDLNKCVEYSKTIEFFSKAKGLHSYFERFGGSLESAIGNAEHSICEKNETGRDYTYSELGELMNVLKHLEECTK